MEIIPSASKVTKVLTDVISNHVKQHTQDILKCIAQDYDLVFEDLITRYGNRQLILDVGKSKKKSSLNDTQTTEPKKRGRKKKQKEELIETDEYDYNGVTFLVDAENNVYTYNIEQPVLIGTKLVDGRIKFLIVE